MPVTYVDRIYYRENQYKRGYRGDELTWDVPNYFYFEDISGSNNTLTLTRNNSNGQCPVVTLEYSTDGVNWQEWQAVNDVRTYTIPANGKFYLRGNNAAFGQNANGYDYHQFASTGNIEAHGSIMTLLDKTGASTSFATSGTFKSLFQNMTTLKTTPDMPATTLTNSCYASMFKGSGITQTPELPATNILTSSYYQTFMNCTSLTKAGKMTINSFTGTNNCREMYSGCANLTDISGITINTTNIAPYSFKLTFQNCTSLTKAVPMTIAQVGEFAFDSCYDGCSALTDISGVHITAASAGEGSFKIMFKGTAITESPDLSSIKTLHAATNNGSFSFMFQNCANLNKVTVGCSTWDTNYANSWLSGVAASGTFMNLGSATIPTGNSGIPSGWVELKSKALSFTNKSSSSNTLTLTRNGSAPVINLEYSTDGVNWQEWQESNNVRTYSIPANGTIYLRGNNESLGGGAATDYHRFASTGNFEAHGNIMSLLDKTLQSTTITGNGAFRYLFANCTRMTTSPDMPATAISANCYNATYYGCTNLVSIPSILPATSLRGYCYSQTFQNCSKITTAPILPAPSLSGHSYTGMFNGCSMLNKVITYATNWDADQAENFLNNVSATGDFYNLGGATIPTGTNGIPSGWTEHTSL